MKGTHGDTNIISLFHLRGNIKTLHKVKVSFLMCQRGGYVYTITPLSETEKGQNFRSSHGHFSFQSKQKLSVPIRKAPAGRLLSTKG